MSNKFKGGFYMGCKSRFHVDIMALSNNVTPSLELCVVSFPNGEKVWFIVDCGIFQGDEDEVDNASFPFDASNISFALVTHNHVDHVGRLPLLARKGFRGNVYATATTCKLLPESLMDCWRISKNNRKTSNSPMIYDEEDVFNILNQRVPCKYKEPVRVHDRIEVYFFRNCHLPGAALILVKVKYPKEEDINILFTGDYNSKSTFQHDVCIPKWILDLPLIVIQEST